MDKKSIQLTDEQYELINLKLPKGYFLMKTKERPTKNNSNLNEAQWMANDTLNCSEDSYIKSKQGGGKKDGKKINKKVEEKKKTQKSEKYSKSEEQEKQMPIVESKSNQKKNIIQIQKAFKEILSQLMKKKSSEIFIQPVDPIKLQIPTYFDIIKYPMALETMRDKLTQHKYSSFKQFKDDLDLIVKNSIKYNVRNDYIIKLTKKFEKDCQVVVEKYKNFLKKFDERKIRQEKDEKKGKYLTKEKREEIYQGDQQRSSSQSQKKIVKSNKIVQKSEKDQKQTSQPVVHQEQTQLEKNSQPELETSQKISPKSQITNMTIAKNIKIYSIRERTNMITRIQKLDKSTMREFFLKIKFRKGEAIDFKLMEDEQIKQLEEELVRFQKIFEEKLKKIKQEKIENSESEQEQFEMQEDEDFIP